MALNSLHFSFALVEEFFESINFGNWLSCGRLLMLMKNTEHFLSKVFLK